MVPHKSMGTNDFNATSGVPPDPRPGFETDVIREVERFVSRLPAGAAVLQISRIPNHADWPEPCFQIIPENPKAARFEGIVVKDDLTLIVGEAEREFIGFAKGGNIVPGTLWRQDLLWIWETVIAGGFAQRHYLGSRGQVIGYVMKLPVCNSVLVFRNGRRTERLFGRERARTVVYESYITG